MRRLAKLDKRGQLTIPKEFREALALCAGARLLLTLEDGKLTIQPVPVVTTMGSPWLKGLYASLAPAGESPGPLRGDGVSPKADAPRRSRARRTRA